jgi:aryl-alcohol dehydrogenase-like predicted oxidoreductase
MREASKVIVGTWPLSGDYGLVDLKTVQNTLEHCYELGFKEFDTAPSYGNGFMEFCLGKVFYGRDDVLINTKMGNLPFRGKNFDLENLVESFNQSLRRLSRDSVNILFLHNPRDEVKDFKILLDFMDKLKHKGKIRYSGISLAKNYDYSQKIALSEFDVVQDDANLLSMDFLKLRLPPSTQFMARSPLANGLLSGNMTSNSTFPSDDHRSQWLKGDLLHSYLEKVDAIKKISNIELPSLARKFLLKNDKVDKIIFGVKKYSHVDDIVKDLNSPPLDGDIEKKLITLYESNFKI